MLSYKWVAKGPCYLIRAQWPGRHQEAAGSLSILDCRVPWRGARAVSGLANDGRGVDASSVVRPRGLLNAPGPSVWVIVRGGVRPHGFPDIQNILILVFQNECGSAGGQANRPGLSESRRKPDMKDALSNMKSNNFFELYQVQVSDNPVKHEYLKEVFIAAIEGGYWRDGEKFPTEQEMAALVPFSLGTIQKAVGSLVSSGYVQRKEGLGRSLFPERSAWGALDLSSALG